MPAAAEINRGGRPRAASPSRPVSVRLSALEHDHLLRWAELDNVSLTRLIRRAIRRELELLYLQNPPKVNLTVV